MNLKGTTCEVFITIKELESNDYNKHICLPIVHKVSCSCVCAFSNH